MVWEFDFLYHLQGIHNSVLDPVMVFFSTIGNAGILWIVISIVLAIIPKTRKCGITMCISMAIGYVLGNCMLKNLIARPRPCAVDPHIPLLIKYPSEYSFPSGHTTNGFSAAVVFFLYYRKPGIGMLLLAAVIAFSRMYLFVHYPTDILGGLCLGIFDAVMSYFLMKFVFQKIEEKKNRGEK